MGRRQQRAFQIEGATHGRRPRRVDLGPFARTPGKVANGDTGDPACDHYHRWRDDVELMRVARARAATASRSPGRASSPTAAGRRTRRGLDFYRRLVDGLLERGIAPLATLYHWDLPQALEDDGGWASRDTVDRFAEYAELVFDGLGDRVDDWITHNEPWVTSFLGYAYGVEGARRDATGRAASRPRTTRCSRTAHGRPRLPRRRATQAGSASRST